MNDGLRLAVLLTDAFGGFGGISKFNCDLLDAFNASAQVEHVTVLPRLIPDKICGLLPESMVYDRMASRGKISYMRRVLSHSFRDSIDVVVCGHANLLAAAWLMSRLRHTKLILIIHGIEAWQPPRSKVLASLFQSVDFVVSVSRLTAERFSSWSKFPLEKCIIQPNCVDLTRFESAPPDEQLIERYGLKGCKVLMTLGRLALKERYKGFDEVMDVLPSLIPRFPNLKYLIVGDGQDRQRLEEKAKVLSIGDHVVFAGKIPESDKVAHYNLADAYVMPSSGEGFGIVLIEAAACGVPVIGSIVDGSREALLNGELGQLVHPADVDALVKAIVGILSHPGERRRSPLLDTFSIGSFQGRVDHWLKLVSQDVVEQSVLAHA